MQPEKSLAVARAWKRERRHRAFSEGCDARLAGLPITANPYKKTCKGWRQDTLHNLWRSGYLDMNAFWCRQLPPEQRRALPAVGGDIRG